MRKLLVPVKRVPAPETKIRLLPDGSGIDVEGVTFVVNPFDEIALEEALRIRERDGVEEIVAVTIGTEECVEQLRTALAMGADRALLVEAPQPLDSLAVATVLRAVVAREAPDMVLMGKQAIDDDSNQAGQMHAALLGWPQATFVSKLEFIDGGGRIESTRETDAGLEVIRVRLPAVVTPDLRLHEPRYVSLPGIVRARSKPVDTLTLAELGVSPSSTSRTLGLTPPPSRAAGVRVRDVDELVSRLRDEARVL